LTLKKEATKPARFVAPTLYDDDFVIAKRPELAFADKPTLKWPDDAVAPGTRLIAGTRVQLRLLARLQHYFIVRGLAGEGEMFSRGSALSTRNEAMGSLAGNV
jgi:hypothetical protein